MPPTGGIGLGTATGTVVINAQVTAAAQQIAAFSQQTQQQMAQVSASTNQTSASLTGLTNTLKQVAGAFGVNLGIQGAVQLGRAAVAAAELATAYNRQQVAAESLAGSQAELNTLLEVYDKATGGILDQSSQLANVTQLMSVGFADSAQELEKFATAIRGISIATGRGADTITQNLILELFSQRGQRLDQLGLQYDKVRAKATELQAADSNLTKEQAYQNAVLDEAARKYGDLGTSAAGAATGLEKAEAAAKDAQLAIGQALAPPVNLAGNALAIYIQSQIDLLHGWERAWQDLSGAAQRAIGISIPTGMQTRFTESSAGRDIGRHGGGAAGGGPAVNPNQDDIDKAWSDHFDKVADIERQAGAAILSENTSYQNRRLRSEESYQENVARSAADFAKGRMRAQEDYENSILDIMRQAQQRDARMAEDHGRDLARMQSDSAKRLGDLQEDLDRNIAQKRADSAEKLADFAADRDKAIADKRSDSADRLLDIEKDYARQQEQAVRAHANAVFDAAAEGDGRALYMEQRRYAQEQADAAKNHNEKVSDENDKLQESIDNVNNAYDEKVADEKEALEKSINQANEAHDRQVKDEQEALQQRIDDANDAYERQLADAKAADAQRITDMAAHFEEQKTRENEDQIDRMGRMADDHTAEMTQMDTEHKTRLTQISTHAGEERTALDAEFRRQLSDLGVHNAAYDKAEAQHKEQIRLSQAIFHEEEQKALTDANIAMLKILQQNPFLTTEQSGSITTAITALGQLITTNETNIGILQGLLDALPANPYILAPTTPPSVPSVNGSMLVGAAMVGASNLPAAAGGLSISFAQGAVQVYGAPGQSVEGLADIIDARIIRAVRVAAGRI